MKGTIINFKKIAGVVGAVPALMNNNTSRDNVFSKNKLLAPALSIIQNKNYVKSLFLLRGQKSMYNKRILLNEDPGNQLWALVKPSPVLVQADTRPSRQKRYLADNQ
jgi:hypothetical protein